MLEVHIVVCLVVVDLWAVLRIVPCWARGGTGRFLGGNMCLSEEEEEEEFCAVTAWIHLLGFSIILVDWLLASCVSRSALRLRRSHDV